ncbi:MAG: M23 family metallopeptidase [Pseudomonadota bacterium]
MSLPRHHRANAPRRAVPDLGSQPALAYANGRALPDRHQFNWRWLFGTFLTGIAGTGLMGGALLAAVDGETRFTIAPYSAQYENINAALGGTAASRKTDRFQPLDKEPVRRHLVQIAMTTRVGDKEIVRTVPFARVLAPLSMQRTELSHDIPSFDPMRIFADAGAPLRDEPQAINEKDSDMSMLSKTFAAANSPISTDDTLSDGSVLKLVRQSVALTAGSISSGTISMPDEERATAGEDIGITAENVTAVPKTGIDGELPLGKDEQEILVHANDTMATLLVNAGASLAEARMIIDAMARNFKADDLHDGQRLRYTLAPAPTDANPDRKVIIKVTVVSGRSVLATAALDENGSYMAISGGTAVEEGATVAEIEREETPETRNAPTLYASLYETGLRYKLPRELINELIKVYSYDFDFQRRVRPGDSFEVFYAAEEEQGKTPDRGDILYAALTVGGTSKRYYRFKTEDDGLIDFYDENGNSAKKFLMRKPITAGNFTSSFGFRRHPILGYSRMHTGVDWQASTGTPILAAGAGTIVKASPMSGYGNRVEIQHANGYRTTYNHMSAYGRGITVGSKIYQGQVIGYVGTTGLSTGAHLHYEVLVNGSFVDPMRIKVPRGRVLEGRVFAGFERERERVQMMMRKATDTRVAGS